MKAETKYYHRGTGKILEVAQSFNDMWIVATRKPNGSLQRFKSRACPPCRDRDECQANLDAFALARRLPESVSESVPA